MLRMLLLIDRASPPNISTDARLIHRFMEFLTIVQALNKDNSKAMASVSPQTAIAFSTVKRRTTQEDGSKACLLM